MTTSNSSDLTPAKSYFVNFNQDFTSLSVGSKNGYRIFSLSNIDNLEQIHSNGSEDIRIVERLFSSSLVAVVCLSSPRKLKVGHYKKGTEICNYSYSNSILAVKLNRVRLVVCLEESIYIHNIRDMKVAHTIRDTPPNPQGICALSSNNDLCFLAYPGSATSGEVQIFDALNLHAKTVISAHDSPLAALAFSPNGKRLATASEKGTVIRVFSVLDSTRLYEFRRGVKRCVSISCLAFSKCGSYLSCSSNTETVHVFKLDGKEDGQENQADENPGTWMGYLTTMLPSQVTEVFNQGRAFATVYLPFQNVRNVIGITDIHNELRLLVATEEGFLYVYNIPKEGGELKLFREHRLDGSADEIKTDKASSDGSVTHSDPINIDPRESEKLREMAAATETPPKSVFQFNDDQEYPPLGSVSTD